MTIQTACQVVLSEDVVLREDFGRPKCPRCASVLLIAEESQFNVRGRIDHAWSCDFCGHGFVTSIRVLPELGVSVGEPA
jgi:RNase P subunit RPR2